jgi:hypothetical protein
MSAPHNLADARAVLVLDRLVHYGRLRLGAHQDKLFWQEIGLTLKQRDRAIDALVSHGAAHLVPEETGIVVLRGCAP